MKILFDFDAKTIELKEPVELVKLYDTFDEYCLDWKEWIVVPTIVHSDIIWTPTPTIPYSPSPSIESYKITC